MHQGRVNGVRIGRERIQSASTVVTTGGLAYPQTGSTGDGFRWLERIDHTIIQPEPSLVPVIVHETWIQSLQGLSFPNLRISVLRGDRVLERAEGKVLITHFGLSGPGILNLASRIADIAAENTTEPTRISLNFFPQTDGGSLDRELQQLLSSAPRRKLKNILETMLPPRLAARILSTVEPQFENPAEITGSSVPKNLRKRILQLMQDYRVTFKELQGEDWALVSRVGVPCDEVDFRSLESKIVPGLFVAGDILDINRPSGGYSLLICWATGFVAGESTAARRHPPAPPPT